MNKNKDPDPPKNIDQSFYYMNNSKPEYYLNNNKNMNYNNNFYFNQNKNNCNGCYYNNCNNNINNNTDLFKRIFCILFCFLIAFLVYDFIIIYRNVKNDNNIEKNRCMEEFKENNCSKIKISDGPIINEYCKEKLKCISTHTVYFHVVLIKYIRSVICNCVEGYNLISLSLFSFTLLMIYKMLY